jgi:hypothetical protein
LNGELISVEELKKSLEESATLALKHFRFFAELPLKIREFSHCLMVLSTIFLPLWMSRQLSASIQKPEKEIDCPTKFDAPVAALLLRLRVINFWNINVYSRLFRDQ